MKRKKSQLSIPYPVKTIDQPAALLLLLFKFFGKEIANYLLSRKYSLESILFPSYLICGLVKACLSVLEVKSKANDL